MDGYASNMDGHAITRVEIKTGKEPPHGEASPKSQVYSLLLVAHSIYDSSSRRQTFRQDGHL